MLNLLYIKAINLAIRNLKNPFKVSNSCTFFCFFFDILWYFSNNTKLIKIKSIAIIFVKQNKYIIKEKYKNNFIFFLVFSLTVIIADNKKNIAKTVIKLP